MYLMLVLLYLQDIAVLTNDASRCDMYKEESENVKGRYACEVPKNYKAAKGWRNYYIPNTKEECDVCNTCSIIYFKRPFPH